MIFSSQIKTFGLDISDQSIKVAQINSTGYGLQLTICRKINLPSGILGQGEIKNEVELIKYIKKLINECQPEISQPYVVACLPEVKTFIKLITLTQRNSSLTNEIKQELPHHIPLPLENISFDWQIISQNKNNFEILIGVAPQITVNNFTQLLRKCDLIPVALEIEAQAIVRAIRPKNNFQLKKKPWLKELGFNKILRKIKIIKQQKDDFKKQPKQEQKEISKTGRPEENSSPILYFIIDCGASRSGLIAWADETIKFTTSLKTSGNDLTQIISQKLDLDLTKAEKIKTIYGLKSKGGKAQVRRILLSAIEELGRDIIKTKEFCQTHFPDHCRDYEIILTGGGANLAGLDLELSRQLGLKVNLANPLINLGQKQKIKLGLKEAQSYTTAIGLALRSHFIKDY